MAFLSVPGWSVSGKYYLYRELNKPVHRRWSVSFYLYSAFQMLQAHMLSNRLYICGYHYLSGINIHYRLHPEQLMLEIRETKPLEKE